MRVLPGRGTFCTAALLLTAIIIAEAVPALALPPQCGVYDGHRRPNPEGLDKYLSIGDVRLGKTTLGGAIRAFGPAKIHLRQDPATHHMYPVVCYQSDGGYTDGELLMFEGDGLPDMKDMDQTLSGFELRTLPQDKKYPACSRSSKRSRTVNVGKGLRLGMTEKEVEQLLGPAMGRDGSTLYWAYDHKARLTATDLGRIRAADGDYDPSDPYHYEDAAFAAKFLSGRLSCVSAFFTDTL